MKHLHNYKTELLKLKSTLTKSKSILKSVIYLLLIITFVITPLSVLAYPDETDLSSYDMLDFNTSDSQVEKELYSNLVKANASIESTVKGKLPYDSLGYLGASLILMKKLGYTSESEIPTESYYFAENVIATLNTSYFVGMFTDTFEISKLLDDTYLKTCSDASQAKIETFKSLSNKSQAEKLQTLTNEATSWYKAVNSVQLIFNTKLKYSGLDYNPQFVLESETLFNNNKFLTELFDISKTLGIVLGEESNLYRQDILNIDSMSDLVSNADNNDFNSFYLQGVALSSTFIPLTTRINDENTYSTLFENINPTELPKVKNLTQKRLPLYYVDDNKAVTNYLKNINYNKAKLMTLRVFEEFIKDESNQLILVTKNTSAGYDANYQVDASKPTDTPTTPTTQEDGTTVVEPINSPTTITENESSLLPTYSDPLLVSAFVSPVYPIHPKTRQRYSYALRSNYTKALLINIFEQLSKSAEYTTDLDSLVGIDAFGNIVTESGIVVLPSICNPSYYSDFVDASQPVGGYMDTYLNAMFPINVASILTYPKFTSNELISATTESMNVYTHTYSNIINSQIYDTLKTTLESDDPKYNITPYYQYISTFKTDKGVLRNKQKFDYPTLPYFNRQPYEGGKRFYTSESYIKSPASMGFFNWSVSKIRKTWNSEIDDTQLDLYGSSTFPLVLNLEPPLITISDTQISSSSSLSNEQVISQIYLSNLAYLTIDKETLISKKAHNGTLNYNLLNTLAMQVSKGDSNINNLTLGETIDYSENGENALSVIDKVVNYIFKTIYSIFTGLPFTSTIFYTPKLTDINIIGRLKSILEPLFVILILVYVLAVILSWQPFRIISSPITMLSRLILGITLGLFLYQVTPTATSWIYNTPFNLLYQKKGVENTLVSRESKEKQYKLDLSRLFTSSTDLNNESYVTLAELNPSQYKMMYEMINGDGSYKRDTAILNFVNAQSNLNISDNVYLNSNSLAMTVDDIYSSFSIKGYSTTGSNLISPNLSQVNLKQSWETPTELHYFTPYHLMIENLLYKFNTLTNMTNSNVMQLSYPTGYKYIGYTKNFLNSVYFLKTPSEKARFRSELTKTITDSQDGTLDEAYANQLITVLNGIDLSLGNTQDLLGILEWSGIVESGIDARPYGASVIDDITVLKNPTEIEPNPSVISSTGWGVNVFDTHSMENTKNSIWYQNTYFRKAREELENISKTSKLTGNQINWLINGKFSSKDVKGEHIDNESYVDLATFAIYYGDASVSSSDLEQTFYCNDYVLEFKEDKLFSNGIYLKDSPLKNNKVSLKDLSYALGGSYYFNTTQNIALSFVPNLQYSGNVGLVYQKATNVTTAMRDYIDVIYPIVNNTSDENLIKTIALYGLLQFNKEFSSITYPMYPKKIQSNNLSLDTYLKTSLVNFKELVSNASTANLVEYTTAKTTAFGSTLLILLVIALFLYMLLKVMVISIAQLIIPIYLTLIFVFRTNLLQKNFKEWLKIMFLTFVLIVLMLLIFLGGSYFVSVSNIYMLPTLLVVSILVTVVLVLLGKIIVMKFFNWFKDTIDIAKNGASSIKGMVEMLQRKDSTKTVIGSDNVQAPPSVPTNPLEMNPDTLNPDTSNTTPNPTNMGGTGTSIPINKHLDVNSENKTPYVMLDQKTVSELGHEIANVSSQDKKMIGNKLLIKDTEFVQSHKDLPQFVEKTTTNSKSMRKFLETENVEFKENSTDNTITYYKPLDNATLSSNTSTDSTDSEINTNTETTGSQTNSNIPTGELDTNASGQDNKESKERPSVKANTTQTRDLELVEHKPSVIIPLDKPVNSELMAEIKKLRKQKDYSLINDNFVITNKDFIKTHPELQRGEVVKVINNLDTLSTLQAKDDNLLYNLSENDSFLTYVSKGEVPTTTPTVVSETSKGVTETPQPTKETKKSTKELKSDKSEEHPNKETKKKVHQKVEEIKEVDSKQ